MYIPCTFRSHWNITKFCSTTNIWQLKPQVRACTVIRQRWKVTRGAMTGVTTCLSRQKPPSMYDGHNNTCRYRRVAIKDVIDIVFFVRERERKLQGMMIWVSRDDGMSFKGWVYSLSLSHWLPLLVSILQKWDGKYHIRIICTFNKVENALMLCMKDGSYYLSFYSLFEIYT